MLTAPSQCDRNLPVCNHCAEDEEPECNYTPKKRHKVPSDHVATRDRPVAPYVAKTASFLVSELQGKGSPSPDDEANAGSSCETPNISASCANNITVDADGDDPMDGKNESRAGGQPNADANFSWVGSVSKLPDSQGLITPTLFAF